MSLPQVPRVGGWSTCELTSSGALFAERRKPGELNDFQEQECIHDLALVVVKCGFLKKWIGLMSQMPFHRGFYTNLVRAALAGNGVTATASLLTQFSPKALLFLPFGNQGLGPLGDVVFNSCWIFSLTCLTAMLRQLNLPKWHLHIPQ